MARHKNPQYNRKRLVVAGIAAVTVLGTAVGVGIYGSAFADRGNGNPAANEQCLPGPHETTPHRRGRSERSAAENAPPERAAGKTSRPQQGHRARRRRPSPRRTARPPEGDRRPRPGDRQQATVTARRVPNRWAADAPVALRRRRPAAAQPERSSAPTAASGGQRRRPAPTTAARSRRAGTRAAADATQRRVRRRRELPGPARPVPATTSSTSARSGRTTSRQRPGPGRAARRHVHRGVRQQRERPLQLGEHDRRARQRERCPAHARLRRQPDDRRLLRATRASRRPARPAATATSRRTSGRSSACATRARRPSTR